MKRSLYVTVAIAGTLALTSCTSDGDTKPTASPTPSSSSTSTPTPKPSTSAPTPEATQTPAPDSSAAPVAPEQSAAEAEKKDKIAVAVVYQNLFNRVEALTQADIEKANKRLYDEGVIEPNADLWKYGYKDLVPEIQTVDSSGATEEQRVLFYLDMIGTPYLLEDGGPAKVIVPADAITLNGSTATIKVDGLNITQAGKPVDWSHRIKDGAVINLVQKDGKWLLKLDDGLLWNSSSYDERTGNTGGHD